MQPMFAALFPTSIGFQSVSPQTIPKQEHLSIGKMVCAPKAVLNVARASLWVAWHVSMMLLLKNFVLLLMPQIMLLSV
jgi:hypothetical protein